MDKILQIIVSIICRFIAFVFLVWTGEIIIFMVTAGLRKPNWQLHANRNDYFEFEIFASLSFWIGLLFWGILITLAIKYYF